MIFTASVWLAGTTRPEPAPPLPVLPVSVELVTRYESVGYVYDAATNESDNGGSLATAVDVKVYPNLNGLRALRPAETTVVKV